MNAGFDRFLLDGERWMRVFTREKRLRRPALFLDRDGVMIEDRGYLSDPAGVTLVPGCIDLLQHARQSGRPIVVVTNQSGIGRGFFGWREHFLVENRMLELLAAAGVGVDAIFANSAAPRARAPDHAWRKPQPGMLTAAAAALNLDLAGSIIVGDKASDLAAGRAAGLGCGIHVLTGQGVAEREAAWQLADSDFHVVVTNNTFDINELYKNWLEVR